MPTISGFSDEFIANSLYAPEAWFLHELLSVDHEAQRVRARMDTTALGQLVAAQRTDSGHALHVPAACIIQATGVLGNVHAREMLGLKGEEGWFGYGTRVSSARFHRMGLIGPPVIAVLQVKKARQMRGTWFVDYAFEFLQDDEPIYTSEQSAVWLREQA